MKDQCYEFIKGPNNKISIVGFGSYGEVKLAKNTETDEIVAIKMVKGRNAKQEIDVHHKLFHPNIIRLINYYYENQNNMTYLVLEYAENRSLHEKIINGLGQLPKQKVKRYFKDVCKAIQYLHSLKYMHRDIKPENILITKDDHCKLCDFGFAAILEYRSTLCGTYEYMAPEMIQQKPYDEKVDIWALGILLFELIQGSAPFKGETGQDVIKQMKKPIVFSNRFEKQQIDLIKQILRVGPQKRPDVSTILEHIFFKDMRDYEEEEKQINQKWKVELELQKAREEGKLHNIQGQRTGSSWSTQHPQDDKNQNTKSGKPTSQPSFKPNQKSFKYFVPQGMKPPAKGFTSSTTIPTNNNQFSSHNFSQSNNSQPPMNGNLNNSSSYRNTPPSYPQEPKTMGYMGSSKQPMPQPTVMSNIGKGNIPIYNGQQQGNQAPLPSPSGIQRRKY